ncbi:potassium-transporting ATPase subunit KdpC [Luteimicrobium subarcticum]|uniref:Potassium-transporting ATPase KdpC subunit n=1 Tax=Luteimicrobium subarcticum TaxID=620910 RepID=A0A2M8W6U5_9MICO|nr:potassium-transporting ATPase subunit KdpC [Luteimicrobium subarcticum]PJI86646.1 K+-transporting ATPase ATPase C chain [Luteimicrobium subarcticum]
MSSSVQTAAVAQPPAGRALASLWRSSVAGLRMLVLLTVVLGIAYPLAVAGVARIAFPWQAAGSLVTADGDHTTSRSDAVGSVLIGQDFGVPDEGAQWFHGRPSVAGDGYDTLASAGSNLGPLSPDLVAAIDERRAAVAAADSVDPASVPADAVTASGSGLDPHVSPAYADEQVARVATARRLDPATVRRLVAQHLDGRTLGYLGEPRVNVLALNLALARLGA